MQDHNNVLPFPAYKRPSPLTHAVRAAQAVDAARVIADSGRELPVLLSSIAGLYVGIKHADLTDTEQWTAFYLSDWLELDDKGYIVWRD